MMHSKHQLEPIRDRYCDGARKVQSEYGEKGGLDDIVDFRIKNYKTDIWTVLSWLFCIFGIGGVILGVLCNSSAMIIVFAVLALACGLPVLFRRIWYSLK